MRELSKDIGIAKTSGGTRNYANVPKTLANRQSEYNALIASGAYDSSRSFIDESGGFVVVSPYHNIPTSEANQEIYGSQVLAKKGYKVYLEDERSMISKGKKVDGKVYKEVCEFKTINEAGENTIKSALEKASKQSENIETVVLIQNTKSMTKKYVKEQLALFSSDSPKKARDKIKRVIVVGMSGNVHRHKL